MAERKWTAAQSAAIEETNKTLLVSAAAGSGKTSVLIERIFRTLTDEEPPGDISRMLIVTFTRAAAAEMRERISKKLTEAMQNKRSTHLARQLLLLPSAYVSTIDSFCLDLVRAHAVRLGIPPAFRLADAAECRPVAVALRREHVGTLVQQGVPGGGRVVAAGFFGVVGVDADAEESARPLAERFGSKSGEAEFDGGGALCYQGLAAVRLQQGNDLRGPAGEFFQRARCRGAWWDGGECQRRHGMVCSGVCGCGFGLR